jgi:predicted amidohydrolase YtcJ
MTARLAADTILWGGKVLTVDPGFTIAKAVAVAGDRIVAVGGNGEVNRLAGDRPRLLPEETIGLADLAVLDRDYLGVPDEDLQRIRVSTTMVGGRIVHERG